jgi:hypothetical protein
VSDFEQFGAYAPVGFACDREHQAAAIKLAKVGHNQKPVQVVSKIYMYQTCQQAWNSST